MNRILQIGAIAWIISEGMEIYSGGYTVYNSSVSTIAFLLIAIGILSLFRHETLSIVGKVGAICVFAAMLGFTWIAFNVIGSDVVNDLEISQTPLFMISGALVVIGSILIAYWLIRKQPRNLLIGGTLLAVTTFSILISFIPSLIFLQPFSNVILAVALFGLTQIKNTQK